MGNRKHTQENAKINYSIFNPIVSKGRNFRKKQIQQEEDGEEPEPQYANMAQRNQETYIQ